MKAVDVYYQSGGSENLYDEEDGTPVQHNTRSFIIVECNKEYCEYIKTIPEEKGIVIKCFQPREKIIFDRQLIVIDDFKYPDKTVCQSSLFTDDIINTLSVDRDRYIVIGIDLIWCREHNLNMYTDYSDP